MNEEKINVELVYALPAEQMLLKSEVPKGTTIAEAIKLSGILDKFPEIDLEKGKFGIFGKLSKVDTVLREVLQHFTHILERLPDASEVGHGFQAELLFDVEGDFQRAGPGAPAGAVGAGGE